VIRPEPFWLKMSDSESAALVCEEKARLLRRCAVAESNHQLAIQQLTWMIGAPRKPNYVDLNEFVETSRRIVDDAQQGLERHTAEHGC
jgi:hypothetical protein